MSNISNAMQCNPKAYTHHSEEIVYLQPGFEESSSNPLRDT